MTLNPILIRELRARWRGWGAFTLMFLYATGLSVIMAWRYWVADFVTLTAPERPGQHLAALGHDLFLTASLMQGGLWMLISAALCAPAIASERERGLLDSLQLSQLTAGRIVLGKLEAALSFVFLLMLVPLPITAVCFFLGGVSALDFGLVFLLHIVAAVSGAATGVAVSAWSRRTTTALGAAIGVLVAWGFCGLVAFDNASASGRVSGTYPTDQLMHVVGMLGMANPVFTVGVVADPATQQRFSTAIIVWSAGPCAVLLTAVLLVFFARRGVRRTFSAHRPFVERKRHLTLHTGSQSNRLKLQLAEHAPAGTASTLWWNTPLLSYVRFRNPVLQREVHSRFRLRRAATLAAVLKIVGLLALAYYYSQFWWDILTVVYRREAVWWLLSEWFLYGSIVAATLMGARTFTREHETGTWDGLKLSLLPASEIMAGKTVALLLTYVAYSLPLWPLCWCCIREVAPFVKVGVPFTAAGVTLLIVAATAWCCTAWAMLASAISRNTVGAMSKVLVSFLAALGILVVVVPALQTFVWSFQASGTGTTAAWSSAGRDLAPYWNPIVALEHLRLYSQYESPVRYGFSLPYGYAGAEPDLSGPLGCASLLFTTGTLLFLLTWRRLALAMRASAR